MKVIRGKVFWAVCILALFAGCGESRDQEIKEDAVTTEAAHTAPETAAPEDITPEALALREGRTEELVGIALGDRFNYNWFDTWGLGYRHVNPKYQDISYYFDGKGHCFSGFSISSFDENTYWGIRFGKDRGADLKGMFGEPDFYGKPETPFYDKYKYERTAVWQFERATLTIWEIDNKICRLEYQAAEGVADGQGDSETELERDRRAENTVAEAIYQWAPSEVDDRLFAYHNDGDGDVDYDEDEIRALVADFLEENGFGGQTPTGTMADIGNGWARLDYYIDDQERKYYFILWIYHLDNGKVKAAYCAVKEVADAQYSGTILYEQGERGVTREREYDEWGMKRAEASYDYFEGVPIPFVTKEWNLDDGIFLCREHMMTFQEERAIFDYDGKLIGIRESGAGDALKNYLPYLCTCVYDEKGKLASIREVLQEYDIENGWAAGVYAQDYSGQVAFQYSEDGAPERMDYFASSYTHGTYKSSGTIKYDEQGRMLYDDFYVTHGGDMYLYLYRGDSKRPWARVDWCSFMSHGFERITVFDEEMFQRAGGDVLKSERGERKPS